MSNSAFLYPGTDYRFVSHAFDQGSRLQALDIRTIKAAGRCDQVPGRNSVADVRSEPRWNPPSPEWMEDASCAVGPASLLPWINAGGRRFTEDLNELIVVCSRCQVRSECLRDAAATETTNDASGFRGGLTAAQRTRIYKLRAKNRPKRPTVVYFATRGDGRIKIGFSTDVDKRMKALAATLLATVPGGRSEEAALHERFAPYRAKGEWFWVNDELLHLIEQAAS